MAAVRILRREDVERALGMAACIDAVEAAFVAYSAGRAELPGVIHLDVPEARGEIHVKAGHIHGAPVYAVKVASGFYAAEPAAIDGMVIAFDATSGAPVALLLDGGYLTDLRTGAAGGVAARWLAPSPVAKVAVIGTGIQARRQLEALRVVAPGGFDVAVWGRDAARAAAAASDVGGTTAATVAAAVEGTDVVITCTASRTPLVTADMLAPSTLVIAVGSDGEGKQELDPEVLRGADAVVVDSLDQSRRLGELQHAPEQAARAVELGAVVDAGAPRRTVHGWTVCDLTGVGVQDVAAANAVLANVAPGAGEMVEP
ncbi:MAG TPA: ornithine cyclodeaminase family protein [Actinomycetota bacterium]|nr:ornithine cyclodeaminase family protein [Actinomycetota bacterium]